MARKRSKGDSEDAEASAVRPQIQEVVVVRPVCSLNFIPSIKGYV